jgi:putative hydrolase of the HAD superfamily
VTQVRAFVFDFGGVFSQSEASQARLRAYDEALGLPPDTLMNTLYTGEAWELASTGRLSEEQYWERVGKAYQDRLPDEFLRFRQGMFWAEPINEAMVSLARRLHRAYPLAICSNALPELAEILASRPDVAALFDVHVISALVGLRKPDPRIYQLTADRLAVPIETCLLVDDKPRNTDAARSAGMQAIVFESVEQLEAELTGRGLLPLGNARAG